MWQYKYVNMRNDLTVMTIQNNYKDKANADVPDVIKWAINLIG